jgi:hypothetical protein
MILDIACINILAVLEKNGCIAEVEETDKFDFIHATLPNGLLSHVLLRMVRARLIKKDCDVKLMENKGTQTITLRVHAV